ncbi:hypothetical protein FRB90_000044 [Tulasnella sp. 427]|nr:hypothetical protein FRB90_000044 [Tulasnella sp. 427]
MNPAQQQAFQVSQVPASLQVQPGSSYPVLVPSSAPAPPYPYASLQAIRSLPLLLLLHTHTPPSKLNPVQAIRKRDRPKRGVFQVAIPPPVAYTGQSELELPPMEGQIDLNINCQCGFLFYDYEKVKRHWKRSCPDNTALKTYHCDFCEKELTRKDNLKRHMKTCNSNPDFR